LVEKEYDPVSDSLHPRTMSLPQLAKELNISIPTIYKLAHQDRLPVPVIRIGEKRMVVSRSAVDDLLAQRKLVDVAA
jgi:excisionase family DNA binding protein